MFKSFVYYNKVEMSKSLNLNRLNLVFNSNLNKVTKTTLRKNMSENLTVYFC